AAAAIGRERGGEVGRTDPPAHLGDRPQPRREVVEVPRTWSGVGARTGPAGEVSSGQRAHKLTPRCVRTSRSSSDSEPYGLWAMWTTRPSAETNTVAGIPAASPNDGRSRRSGSATCG